MILALLSAGAITVAPPVHPYCEEVGAELLNAVQTGQITNEEAAQTFHRCQVLFPPLFPTT